MAGSLFKNWKFWIGIAISALFLYVAFRGIDFSALKKIISTASLEWIFIGFAFYIVNLITRGLRWQYIFKHVKPVSLWAMIGATLVGYFANNVLPMRLGEIVRAVYIGEKEKCDKSAAFGTIAVERIFDILMAVLVLALTFVLFPFPPEIVGEWSGYFRMAGQGAVLISAVGLASMFIMVRRRKWTLKILEKLTSFLPDKARGSINKLAFSFIDGLAILSNPLEIFILFLLTALVWITNLWPIWASGMAFGIPGMKFNFEDQIFILTAGSVAAAIPASPGFVGTFHFITKKAIVIILSVKFAAGGLSGTGIEPQMFGEWGLSFALLIHALYILTTTISGAIVLASSGIAFSSLKNQAVIGTSQEVGDARSD